MEITQETPQTENNEIIFNKVIEISSDKNNLFKITFLANKSHLNIKAQQKIIYLLIHILIYQVWKK